MSLKKKKKRGSSKELNIFFHSYQEHRDLFIFLATRPRTASNFNFMPRWYFCVFLTPPPSSSPLQGRPGQMTREYFLTFINFNSLFIYFFFLDERGIFFLKRDKDKWLAQSRTDTIRAP